MTFPDNLIRWLEWPALVWAVLACAGAAFCALRVFEQVKCVSPPRPFCTIAAATRWVLGLAQRGIDIKPADMIRLGALMVALAEVLFLAFTVLDFARAFGWAVKPEYLWIAFIIARVAMGSGLMILFAGVHRLATDRRKAR